MADELEFDDEKEFENWLRGAFEAAGWLVYQQIQPENSNKRADLLVHHDNYGWVGVECKYLSRARDGAKVGEAIKQIVHQYRGEHFPHGAESVDLWVFAGYIDWKKLDHGNARRAFKSTLYELGIGTLWANPKLQEYLNMVFSGVGRDTIIDIMNPNGASNGDIERIREEVSKKIHGGDIGLGTCQYDSPGYGCTAPATETHQLGRYEVKLCDHHSAEKELSVWKDLKRAERRMSPDA